MRCSGQAHRAGVAVVSVNCTLGDIPGVQEDTLPRVTLATARLAETAAAYILGLAETINLGHHYGELVPNMELRGGLASFLPHHPGRHALNL